MINSVTKYRLKGVGAGLLLATALPLQASTILDSYIGADDHGFGDVIGDVSKFQINSAEVTLSGNILNVSINTAFAGLGDNGLFSNDTNGLGIGYGDLFLSASWTPNGASPYYADDASNGTTWSYGFSLDNRWMSENAVGTGTLYSLNSGNNQSDILMSEDFLTGSIFRNGQEVAVDRSGNVTAMSNGSWTINTNDQTINFAIDITGTSLLGASNIALHWGPTCANDVIEGVSAVPVPAAVWLFGSGLMALIGVAGRRRHI